MDESYKEALINMIKAFDILFKRIGPPGQVMIDGRYYYRYKRKSIYAAIVLKIARVITGLQAISHLNRLGFLQEQASLQRVVDEVEEDIFFLSLAVISDDITERHDKFLESFFEEEFEEGIPVIESTQTRFMVPRSKIRAYVGKYMDDPSTGVKVGKVIHKTYSGFVHAAAPQIMELYYGAPPSFHLTHGIDSPYYDEHIEDMFNLFLRGIMAVGVGAKALGLDALCNELNAYSKAFARNAGKEDNIYNPN